MKKKKIVIISLCSIIGLIFLDFIIAISFNNSPIIKIRDYYDGDSTVYKDKGIFTNTYKCSDGKTKTVLKTDKYGCPIIDNKKEDKKETINIFLKYCKDNISNYTKLPFYNKISRNRKIIAWLNYHDLYNVSKIILLLKGKMKG